MKFSIAWHKDVLRNQKRSLELFKEEKENYVSNMSSRIERLEAEIKLHEYQIEEAEKEGKMAFDHEKYRIKK